MNLVGVVNLLYLLKREPRNIEQLYDSGRFHGWSHLRKTIRTCMRAGLITYEFLGRTKNPVEYVLSHSLHKRRWNKVYYFYYITPMGRAFLSFYSSWELRKANKIRSVEVAEKER